MKHYTALPCSPLIGAGGVPEPPRVRLLVPLAGGARGALGLLHPALQLRHHHQPRVSPGLPHAAARAQVQLHVRHSPARPRYGAVANSMDGRFNQLLIVPHASTFIMPQTRVMTARSICPARTTSGTGHGARAGRRTSSCTSRRWAHVTCHT